MPNLSLQPDGSIQFDVGEHTRIDIWDGKFSPVPQTPIHDHTFNHVARVMAGRLYHTVYDFPLDPKGEQCLWAPMPLRTGSDTEMVPLPGMVGDAVVFERQVLHAGFSYDLRAGRFHATAFDGFTVVVIVKTQENITAERRQVVACDGRPDDGDKARSLVMTSTPLDLMTSVERAMDVLDSDTLRLALNAVESGAS